MRFFTAIFAAIAIAAPVFGTPIATVPLHEYNGEIRSGRYIVNVKDGVARSTVAGTLKNAATHDWDIANAFAAELDDATLNELRVSPHVEYIEEEGAQRVSRDQRALGSQSLELLERVVQPGYPRFY